MALPEDNLQYVGKIFPIPQFSLQLIRKFIDESYSILKSDSLINELNGKFIIVGDLHGNLIDLLRIFSHHGYPPQSNYIFLGDYIDRGAFSLETIILLIAIKCQYPQHIVLLRGNHEFISVNQDSSFGDEIWHLYENNVLIHQFNQLFKEFPLAALLNKQWLCLHGGIGPSFSKIEQLKTMQTKYSNFDDNPIVQDIVWSDPNPKVDYFQLSPRGSGHLFGTRAFDEFIAENKIIGIVRGHEMVQSGIDFSMNGLLITIHSHTGYVNKNLGATLLISPDSEPISTIFHPIENQVRSRQDATFLQECSTVP